MTSTKGDQLRRDAGGPWLASPVTILWMAPSMLATSVLFSVNTAAGAPLLTGFLANVIALAIVAGLMLGLRATAFRNRHQHPVAPAVIVLSGAALGIIKALITNAIIAWPQALDLTSSEFWGKAISAGLIGVVLLPTVAIVLATRERFRLERAVLIAEVVQSESRHAQEGTAPSNLENEKALAEFVAQATTRLSEIGDSEADAAEVLLDIVNTDLRPLSHKIWQEQNAKYTDFSMRDLTKITMQEHRFSVTLLSAVFTVASLPFLINQTGVAEGLLRVAIVIGLVTLILGGASRVRTSRPWQGIVLFWGAILVLCVAIELVSTALLGPLQPGTGLSFGIIDFLLFAPVALILGCIRVALVSKTAIRAQLAPLLGTAGIDRHRAILSLQYNRDMAQYLHSQVQNRMLASALRIEQSQASGDSLDLKAEMRSLTEMLTQAQASIGSPLGHVGTLDEELGLLSQAWFKTIDLRFTLVGEHVTWTPRTVQSVSRLLDEVITNAVRHGLATEVQISIESVGSRKIAVVAVDNGILETPGPAGLGSALFTTMAGADWALTRDPISSRTRLELLFDANAATPGREKTSETSAG